MTSTERDRIIRLYSLVDAVPFPHSGVGVNSAGISGLVEFVLDMREFQPALKKALYGIACASVHGMIEGEDYDCPDRLMDAMESWIAQRQSEQWKGRPAALKMEGKE